MKIRCARLERRHLRGVVDVHMRAFPKFFLTFLGSRFLSEFYASFSEDETGIGIVAVDPQGHVLGVAAGTLRPARYFRRLLARRWWSFLLAASGAIARRPAIVRRLARALFYQGDAPDGGSRALLSSIAVSPAAQGTGIGTMLLTQWLDEVRRRGGRGCYLTTDAADNEPTNQFYLRAGWSIESCYATPEGRRMNRYVLDFAPQAGAGAKPWPNGHLTSPPRQPVS